MSNFDDVFDKAIELAAHCGEYEDDFLLKANIGGGITIYANIHACTEVLSRH